MIGPGIQLGVYSFQIVNYARNTNNKFNNQTCSKSFFSYLNLKTFSLQIKLHFFLYICALQLFYCCQQCFIASYAFRKVFTEKSGLLMLLFYVLFQFPPPPKCYELNLPSTISSVWPTGHICALR